MFAYPIKDTTGSHHIVRHDASLRTPLLGLTHPCISEEQRPYQSLPRSASSETIGSPRSEPVSSNAAESWSGLVGWARLRSASDAEPLFRLCPVPLLVGETRFEMEDCLQPYAGPIVVWTLHRSAALIDDDASRLDPSTDVLSHSAVRKVEQRSTAAPSMSQAREPSAIGHVTILR